MKYIASVRDKETRELTLIEREYATKKAFEKDLRENNYSIRFITTEDKFDEACEKWDIACQKSKAYHQGKNGVMKEYAAEYGISVAHYTRAYKAYHEAVMRENSTWLSFEDFIEIYK